MSVPADNPSARKNVTASQAHNHQRRRVFEDERRAAGQSDRVRLGMHPRRLLPDGVPHRPGVRGGTHVPQLDPHHVMDDVQTPVLTRHPHFWIIGLDPGDRRWQRHDPARLFAGLPTEYGSDTALVFDAPGDRPGHAARESTHPTDLRNLRVTLVGRASAERNELPRAAKERAVESLYDQADVWYAKQPTAK
jgi:hypothetical protein